MAYQVLFRKWRPQFFSEVVGQDHIVQSLRNSLISQKVGHAYIFSGTRGVGKTSLARIFSKCLRCENLSSKGDPCNQCRACLEINKNSSIDILELDAASRNSIDDIRDLISTILTLPTFGRYKVYIIDEVHMLSASAFNVLLKTLEEPPEHVVFILATTQPEKIIDTILSRCQKMSFRNLSLQELISYTKILCEKEEIIFKNEKSLERVCLMGRGSVRDTLSLLDQILSYTEDKNIDDDVVLTSLGIPQENIIKDLLGAIFSENHKNCLRLFRQALISNVDREQLVLILVGHLFKIIENYDHKDYLYKNELLEKGQIDNISLPELFWIYENMHRDLEWSLQTLLPEQTMEVVLQKVCLRRKLFNSNSSLEKNTNNVMNLEEHPLVKKAQKLFNTKQEDNWEKG